jgi:hypothetical protein
MEQRKDKTHNEEAAAQLTADLKRGGRDKGWEIPKFDENWATN